MTLILKQIFAFLKMLNSETGHNQIAAGVAAGFVLGMAPAFSLQTLLIFLFIFIFRIQAGAAFLMAFFFKFIAWALDPAFDQLGRGILENEGLKPLFVTMYNMPLVPLTRFNNSIFMGAGALSLLLSPLVFFVSRSMILKYRVTVVARIKQTKAWKAVQATSLYKWYYSYDNLYN